MKKIILSIFVFYCLSSVAFAGSFPDVPEDHDNFKAIEFLKAEGVINGYENGTFGPDNLVNRAEAVKILIEAFDISINGNFSSSFSDVSSSDWFFEYVMAAKRDGILEGYEDGSFKPENKINLAETLKIAPIAARLQVSDSVANDVFSDVPQDAWYAKYAQYAKSKNVILADDEGKINAGSDMSRADFAEVIYRMIKVKESGGEAYPLHDAWDFYQSSNLPFKMKYDDSWQILESKEEVTFFKSNDDFFQFSPVRVFPNSAKVIVSLDENPSSVGKEQYFGNLRTVFQGAQFKEFSLEGNNAIEILYPEERIVDWYIYLGNGEVMAVYTEYGDGVLGFQLQSFIKAMLSTFEFSEGSGGLNSDQESVLSRIFENLLIENMGMQMIDLLSDAIIIESDTIGVGTGVVDYYYSENFNYSFKYERSSDLILDTREGRTSAF